jgi:hypothetical protein
MSENNKGQRNDVVEGDEASEVEEASLLGAEEIEETDEPVDDRQRTAKLITLLPVHAAGGPNITRRVGRPRQITRKPNQTDLEYHQAMTEEKVGFIESDPVVKAIGARSDAVDMLRIIKHEVAKEAAALHFQRIENEKLGKDTAQVSTRRIDALTKIAGIELEIKKMGADVINLKSEKFQKVFGLLIGHFREMCVEIGMRPEQIDLLFNRLSTSMEGWEENAAELVR